MNPYVIMAAMAVYVGTALGAYFYRAHQDEGAVEAGKQEVVLQYTQLAAKAKDQADAQTKALQEAADARTTDLQSKIDQSRSDYEKLKHRPLPKCPVPAADVGVLLGPPATGGAVGAAPAGSGPGSAQSGTVDAGALIVACEYNKGAFERNLDRLNSCIATYDAARQLTNGTVTK